LPVLCLLAAVLTPLPAQDAGTELFEKKIRPVLAAKCYACHSSKMKAPMGGLVIDTKAGLRKGGASGPALVPGKPAESRLIKALAFTDPQLQMPPSGKLGEAVLNDFTAWVQAGAPDPRAEEAASSQPAAPHGMDIETGRKWWAFQPVREQASPGVKNASWSRTKIDSFLLAKLEDAKLSPSPQADPRTLLRRAYLDLHGLQPAYEEIEAYAADPAADKYEKLIDRLLASPHYGERWGRYWLDVARFAEDNPTSEATNPPYPYAWRYRDWVIEAINKDIPYDRFVRLQLAADEMPGVPRSDLRALGFSGTAPVYHKDARLSKEVIETLASDDWDERVDAVTRGLLGLTVACARCHDHKFDPITTKDYYSLASIFASTAAVQRPVREIDWETEKRFLWMQQRLIHLDYLAKLMTGEPGTKPEEAAQKVVRFRAEIAKLKDEAGAWTEKYPELAAYVSKFGIEPDPKEQQARQQQRRRAEGPARDEPFMNAVYDAGLWVDGSDPDLTLMDYRPGTPRDLPVFLRGNVASPGDPAPRRFLSVLAKPQPHDFQQGAGRLELADSIFRDAAPLAARVMVNRVWAWHFGRPIVNTPSDFGTQGEKPSHPELLDDLSARFIANGWSLKWLHREIMLSAAYRQSSRPRADGEQLDAINRLVWRMAPRRLDIEAFRDSILQASGKLSEDMFGLSADVEASENGKRTVYATISRSRLHPILRLYDFPDASQHSPSRDLTTTPLQQLFVFNSAFLQEHAEALAKRVEAVPDAAERVRRMYRLTLLRDPSPKELDLALSYIAQSTLAHYAQALLSTNEFIFWP
jgi:hypothetical protein